MIGNPISGVSVYVDPVDDQGNWDYSRNSGYGWTDANGSYTASGLAPGNYKVQFRDWSGNYISEYYSDKPDWDSADIISVATSQVVSNINAELQQAGQVSGQVTDTNGNPISGAWVDVQPVDPLGNWDNSRYARSSSTNADGTYNVTGLSSGNYKVQFYSPWGGNYLTQYYNNKADWSSANIISLAAGQVISNINAQLQQY